MSGRNFEDSVIHSGRKIPPVQWKPLENGEAPTNCLKVRDTSASEHFIALCKGDDGNYILKKFYTGNSDNTLDIQLLTIHEKYVEWKPVTTRLPSRAIKAEKKGKYGNLFVGRHPAEGAGMISLPEVNDDENWRFHTDNGKIYESGFDVLCYIYSS